MELIAALDQGTQSTRAILYDLSLRQFGSTAQHSLTQHLPAPGHVEHDANEILACCHRVLKEAAEDIEDRNLAFSVKCVGISNQRESVLVWDKTTGQPLHNVIVWMDTRASDIANRFAERAEDVPIWHGITGLWPQAYFSAFKIKWLCDTYDTLRQKLTDGTALVGTIDSWIIWNLTGGPDGGVHVTDVTNASRTFLMDINKLDWSDELLELFQLPRACLPSIRSCSSKFGVIKNTTHPAFRDVPITGCAGDQQASCIGHGLFADKSCKCTLGTGAFVIQNTGNSLSMSRHLLTTVCMKLGDAMPAVYGLEGAIADVGGGISWLQHNLNAIEDASEVTDVLKRTPDTGDVYFVPAFSGLYAPQWRQDARGTIVGLTNHTRKDHISRAMFESIGYRLLQVIQTFKDVESSKHDNATTPKTSLSDGDPLSPWTRLSAGRRYTDEDLHTTPVQAIRVDGGLTQNVALMQLVADITGTNLERSSTHELSALGVAIAAGVGCGIWPSVDHPTIQFKVGLVERRWLHRSSTAERTRGICRYEQAVQRSLAWVNPVPLTAETPKH